MWSLLLGIAAVASLGATCKPTQTTVSGRLAPKRLCSGALIFSDEFDHFDLEKWQHENTLAGGGNFEFQYYNNNRSNSFTENGILYLRPTLTADQFGENFLSTGTLNIEGGAPADECTNPSNWGCERKGTKRNILNPVKSARVRTIDSFSFRYGRVAVRAKLPAGDWLWPGFWFAPTYNAYGLWPASGEIDLIESRGNREMYNKTGVNIGTQQVAVTLNYGPYGALNAWRTAHWEKQNTTGFDTDFHLYEMEWTPEHLKFTYDNEELGTITPPAGGFWELGGFSNSSLENPWRNRSKIAPFDQKFYIIINLAVGGTNGYFPDIMTNPTPKPWKNSSPTALTDFWNRRADWLPTWKLNENNGHDASFQIDYVRIWAL